MAEATKKYIEGTDRALVGIDKFHYSLVKKDTPTTLEYGDMVELPNTIEASVNPNAITATLYADNKAAISYAAIGNVDVSLTKTFIPNAILAELLGSPKTGAVRHITSGASSPYVGIAWRQVYSDGKYAYVKLHKGKFSEPEATAHTKEESIEFQTANINAQFVATAFEMDGQDADGKSIKFPLLMSVVDELDEEYADEGDKWFDSMLPAGYKQAGK